MALIKCPECGKEISNMAEVCIHCGFPVAKYSQSKDNEAMKSSTEKEKMLSTPQKRIENTYDYNAPTYGIEKRKCPVCGGTNYSVFVEEVVLREGKTKSTTSLNLNPLKPFTIFNHKEKVVRKPITKQVSKFTCNDCGKIFN